MLVKSERNIDESTLLNDLKFNLDKKDDKAGRYNITINRQLIVDCYDLIKELVNERDDLK